MWHDRFRKRTSHAIKPCDTQSTCSAALPSWMSEIKIPCPTSACLPSIIMIPRPWAPCNQWETHKVVTQHTMFCNTKQHALTSVHSVYVQSVSCLHAWLMHAIMMPVHMAYLLGRARTSLQATWLWETETTIGTSTLPDMQGENKH